MYNDLLCCCYSDSTNCSACQHTAHLNWVWIGARCRRGRWPPRNGTNKRGKKYRARARKTTNQNNSATWCTSPMQKREQTQKYSAHIVFFSKRSNWNISNASRIIDLHVFLHFFRHLVECTGRPFGAYCLRAWKLRELFCNCSNAQNASEFNSRNWWKNDGALSHKESQRSFQHEYSIETYSILTNLI